MRTALAQYGDNAKRAKDLVGIASALSARATAALDTGDILRASVVLGVSALDAFVHDVARKGMIEIAACRRPPTDAYHRFAVSLRAVGCAVATGGTQWLEDEIRERHSWVSFQDPDKLADAIRLVSGKELWKEIGALLAAPPKDTKAHLSLIVDRRNKIAHEADMDPSFPGARWPIDATLASDALTFLDAIANAIFVVVTTP